MSGLFGSTTIKGNRLTEFSNTTATVGITKPQGYGRYTTPGNVGWAPLPPKEHTKKKRQGKGGVKTETYTYTLAYAIFYAKGPIYGYWWIKRNGKVVYTQDPAAPVEDQAYAAKWQQKVTFYYGTKTQMPDSTIESYEGTGQVSAFRDDAYMVVEDDDVTEGGGAVPNYEACIIANGIVYGTSPPYPVYTEDSSDSAAELLQVYSILWPVDATGSTSDLISAELREINRYYTMGAEATSSASDMIAASLNEINKYYTMTPEAMESTSDMIGGSLNDIRISYTMVTEATSSTSDLISGVLT